MDATFRSLITTAVLRWAQEHYQVTWAHIIIEEVPAEIYGEHVLTWYAEVVSITLKHPLPIQVAIDPDGILSINQLDHVQPRLQHLYPSSAQTRPTKATAILRGEALSTEGRLEGIQFALAHIDTIEHIERELSEQEQYILARHIDNPTGSSAPNASPRIYKEGYIAGLQHALAIIQQEYTRKDNTKP